MLWGLWIVLTVSLGLYVLAVIVYGGDRSFLLIGRTTSGHHQIELACDACHTSVFGGADVLQDSCVTCHGAELKVASDSHPKSKFTDPRNADRTAVLDATYCVTCHKEHRPGITHAMGVTMPGDYCFLCHHDIADDRPSHKGLAFTTCASAGCHRFHDNRALYRDFLIKHVGEPAQLDTQLATLVQWLKEKEGTIKVAAPLTAKDADAPAGQRTDAKVLGDWARDRHAQAGVNCSGCHTVQNEPARWIAAPKLAQCKSCHAAQASTFTEGKHGMRLREGLLATREGPFGLFKQTTLQPMTPAQAWLPMKADARDKEVGCNTCHAAHKYDRAIAKVEACAGCHDDGHTKAYFASRHYDLLKKEAAGDLPPGSGVSCATCHMPTTVTRGEDGVRSIFITHNQNDNLRPNEKMVRSACAQCHGLQFTLDALADPALVAGNFKGLPAGHVESIEWAEKRVRERGQEKKQ